MALAVIRHKPGYVLGAAILLHVGLISAQVNTASGLPVLQVVTFGGFAELQRAMMALVDGTRGVWSGYVDLRQAQQENAALLNWRSLAQKLEKRCFARSSRADQN